MRFLSLLACLVPVPVIATHQLGNVFPTYFFFVGRLLVCCFCVFSVFVASIIPCVIVLLSTHVSIVWNAFAIEANPACAIAIKSNVLRFSPLLPLSLSLSLSLSHTRTYIRFLSLVFLLFYVSSISSPFSSISFALAKMYRTHVQCLGTFCAYETYAERKTL